MGDVTKVSGGYAFKSDQFMKNGIPIIRIGNLTSNTVYLDYEICYPQEFWSRNSTYHVKFGDILIAMSGATIGKIGRYEYTDPALLNQRVGLIRINIDELCSNYIYYFVKSYFFLTQIQHLSSGCAQPNISSKQIESIFIPLPPLETQKQIAKTLDNVSELLAMRKQQLVELDNLIKSTFYELFGDPVANEKGWETGIIKDLAVKIQYGTSEKASTEKLQYPILRMNNITYEGNMDFSDLKYIELNEKDLEKHLVNKGEMLFNRTNSKELVGKTAVYREEQPMAYAGYLVRLVPNQRANSEFISAYLNSTYGKKLLFKMAKNIVGMANINAKELSNIKIYIPPLHLQNQFAEIVTKIEEQKAIVKKSIDETQYLFDSLMSEYFE
nr:restriction endonuclease subunit S [Paenibacillus arenosi]